MMCVCVYVVCYSTKECVVYIGGLVIANYVLLCTIIPCIVCYDITEQHYRRDYSQLTCCYRRLYYKFATCVNSLALVRVKRGTNSRMLVNLVVGRMDHSRSFCYLFIPMFTGLRLCAYESYHM